MLELPNDRVRIYFVRQNEIKDRELLDAYGDLLSVQENQQKKRFYFSRDSHRYLVTRALVRTVLSEYSSIKPRDWRFKPSPHGRPEVINPKPFGTPLSFNISHTRDMIMIGIAQQSIGVDLENINTKRPTIEIADRYFSAREFEDLNSFPVNEQYERFFHYWTLKEAYIKAMGRGLSLPLSRFSFYFSGERDIKISFDPRLTDRPEHWRFWLLRAAKDHVAAVGLYNPEEINHDLEIREMTPLASDSSLPCEILRATEVLT